MPVEHRVGQPVERVGDPRRHLLARHAQRGRRLDDLMAGVEHRHEMHVPSRPSVRPRPPGQHRVVRLVERGRDRVPGVVRTRRPDRAQVVGQGVVDGGDRLPFHAARREQEPGRDQQQRPRHPDRPLRRDLPPRPQPAQRPQPERAVDEQLQAGDRAEPAQPGQDRGNPGHDDHRDDRDPAAAVDQHADQQAGRAAEDRRRPDPLDPVPVRSAVVDRDREQRAERGQQRKLAPPGEERDRQRHPEREHRPRHRPPGDGRLLRPHDLGQPFGHHVVKPVGDPEPPTEKTPHKTQG